MRPDELAAFLEKDYVRFRELIGKLKLQVESSAARRFLDATAAMRVEHCRA
jgi:hypothetical protein